MIAALALSIALGAAADVPQPLVRRIAVVAGNNQGGFGRPVLRFADDDARAIAAVLEQLGGVATDDVHLLVDADRASLEEVLAAAEQTAQEVRAGGTRVEIVFYYSGHSDDDGLLLGNETLPYAWLRDRMTTLQADVRIVIVDSCSSGALVRKKGGKHVPAFVLNETGKVEGQAFLTSSREDEASQESERVGGSFFTQALVSGLRGAADAAGDGEVTLHEAYQFAFDETLARTQKASAGPQHPAWDIQLAGTGDWVATDLRTLSAPLILDGDIAGRVYVMDAAGRLVLEVQKAAGAPLLLGLLPGEYVVDIHEAGGVREARVRLANDKKTELTSAMLSTPSPIPTVARGPTASSEAPAPTTLSWGQAAVTGGLGAAGGYALGVFAGVTVGGVNAANAVFSDEAQEARVLPALGIPVVSTGLVSGLITFLVIDWKAGLAVAATTTTIVALGHASLYVVAASGPQKWEIEAPLLIAIGGAATLGGGAAAVLATTAWE